MEPFSFPSLFVSSARMRGTVHSTAGIGYYLLAWHIHEHTHTKARMQRLTHTHTHAQWKQIGWICSARRNVRHMCLCVLRLDDRAEGMKEGGWERKRKEGQRKNKNWGKKRDGFLGCRLCLASSVSPDKVKNTFLAFLSVFHFPRSLPFFSSSTHSFPSSSILFFRPLLHPWSFSLRVAVDETVRMEGPWVGVGVLLHRWRQGITERQRGEVKSLLILSCCQMVGWW